MTKTQRARVGRIALIAVGLLFLMTGIFDIVRGRLFYPNYWGGPVFAPITILVGLLAMIIGIFRFKNLDSPPREKDGRPTKFPGNDWQKW